MVEINLLPWRLYFHEYLKKQIIKYAITLFILAIVVYTITAFMLQSAVRSESQVVARLQKQWVALNKPQASIAINNSQPIVDFFDSYQRNQKQIIQFLERLIFSSADKIVWQSMLNQGGDIILVGKVTSLQILLSFVRSFEDDKNILHADILKVKSVPHSNYLEFSLRFSAVLLSLPSLVEK